MPLSVFDNRKTPGVIHNLELDASLNVLHDFVNDVSRFPLETGASVVDHIRQEPERVRITGFITNSGIKSYGDDAADTLLRLNPVTRELEDINHASVNNIAAGISDRIATAYRALLEIAGYQLNEGKIVSTRAPKLVDVVTGLTVYTSMAMVSLSVPRNAQNGDSMTFDAEFVKVTFVDSEVTIIQAANVSTVAGRAPRSPEQSPSTKQRGTVTAPKKPTSFAKKKFNKLATGREIIN